MESKGNRIVCSTTPAREPAFEEKMINQKNWREFTDAVIEVRDTFISLFPFEKIFVKLLRVKMTRYLSR